MQEREANMELEKDKKKLEKKKNIWGDLKKAWEKNNKKCSKLRKNKQKDRLY